MVVDLEVVVCVAGDLEIVALVILKLLASAIFISSFSLPSHLIKTCENTTLMEMNTFNISATLNVFKLLTRPSLCLPHATVSTFNQLPVPLNSAFGKYKKVDIRAIVLDKDNCFAIPHSNSVYEPYEVGFLTS